MNWSGGDKKLPARPVTASGSGHRTRTQFRQRRKGAQRATDPPRGSLAEGMTFALILIFPTLSVPGIQQLNKCQLQQ